MKTDIESERRKPRKIQREREREGKFRTKTDLFDSPNGGRKFPDVGEKGAP